MSFSHFHLVDGSGRHSIHFRNDLIRSKEKKKTRKTLKILTNTMIYHIYVRKWQKHPEVKNESGKTTKKATKIVYES